MTDPHNKEFFLAYELIKEGKNVFVTGKAGTGKTTFLKYLKTQLKKNIAVVAPTGIAARNAGGTTLNSLFWIDFGVYPPESKKLRTKAPATDSDQTTIYNHFRYTNDKKKLLQNIDLLIIDEISMVRCDVLDVVDKLMRVFGGGDSNKPFGGKQIVLIGDPFQLPPVVRPDISNILLAHYKSTYFFSARSFQRANLFKIELQKVYRQKEDAPFISLLNKVRNNSIQETDLDFLNQNTAPQNFDFSKKGYVYIGTSNPTIKAVNQNKLKELPFQEYSFQAIIAGTFGDKPTDFLLKLKQDAQVMFIKNDPEKQYVNGTIGKVIELGTKHIKVDTGNSIINVKPTTWYDINYEWDSENGKIKETIKGSFTQYPLKLAWAITVHKSQGLTFEKVYADLAQSWLPGQVYVGLSRCTSLENLKLKTPIPRTRIMTDPVIMEFAASFMTVNSVTVQNNRLESKQKFQKALSLVSDGKILDAFSLYEAARKQYPNWNYQIFPKLLQQHLDKVVYENESFLRKTTALHTEIEMLNQETVKYRKTIIKAHERNNNLEQEIKLLGEDLKRASKKIVEKQAQIDSVLKRKWWRYLLPVS